jgi:hypothetical protein
MLDVEGVQEIKSLNILIILILKLLQKVPSFVDFQLRTILFGFTAFSIYDILRKIRFSTGYFA